jgi:DNA polymerase-3 subunit beta
MNIVVNTAAFAKKLKLVEKIVPQKSILPILSNVLLRASDGELRLSTTNTEVSLSTTCPANINQQGVITAPVKPLLDIVSQITEEQTYLILDKSHVRIAAGSFKMRLQTMTPDDFPTLPKLPETGGMLLPGDVFRSMISHIRYAISDADKRYFINGALLSLTDKTIALVATDGKRLSMTATKRPTPGAGQEIIIPTKTLDVLTSDDGHDDVMFNSDARTMFFVSDDSVLTSRMIEGTFPNYKRIFPADNKSVAKMQRLQLLSALKRVALASPDTRAVTFTLDNTELALSSANAQVGDALEHIPVEYDGPTFKLVFEWTFVHDFLTAAHNQTVKLSLKDATTPSLWSDGDGSELMNVIMMMRN